jgi:two-component system sensor histidine kinase DesK
MSINARLLALHHFLLPPQLRLGWLPYLWLIYLGFFFIKYFFQPPGVAEILAVSMTMTLFLLLYFSAYRRRGLGTLLHIAALTLLAMLWAPFNPGSSVLFIYAASFAYLTGPPKKSVWVVLAIGLLAALTAWLAKPVLMFWLPAAAISVIIGVANIAFGEDARKNAELRLNQAEIKRLAKVAERERIARDLHDVIGHTLSLIVVKSALASRLLEQDTAQAQAEIRSIEDTARNSLQEVRKAISGLHEQSLTEALDQAALAMRSANIELMLDVDQSLQLPARDAAMLGLVIREACTNVIRHANAQICKISLQHDHGKGHLLLDISDDGGGHIRPEGSGIQGMRARLESLGGELQLDPKRGSHLHAWVPLA